LKDVSSENVNIITILQPSPNKMSDFDLNQQQSDQKSPTDNKYNISNLLKHIYTLKYSQKSSTSREASSSAAAASANAAAAATAETSSTTTLSETSGSNSSLKQFWMPDDQVKECFECNEKFTTFRRRHV
jgi:hypothetical protein